MINYHVKYGVYVGVPGSLYLPNLNRPEAFSSPEIHEIIKALHELDLAMDALNYITKPSPKEEKEAFLLFKNRCLQIGEAIKELLEFPASNGHYFNAVTEIIHETVAQIREEIDIRKKRKDANDYAVIRHNIDQFLDRHGL